MEYLSYEAQDANDMHRPLGGMSSFTRALESALRRGPTLICLKTTRFCL